MSDCGVLFYGRYRDDILIIQRSDPDSIVSFLRGIRESAERAGYELERSEMDSKHVTFLDFEVFKRGVRLGWELHTKPSSQKRYLHSDSAHAMNVHLSWPRNEVVRRRNRCLTRSRYLDAKAMFSRALREQFQHPTVIHEVENHIPKEPMPRNDAHQRVFWVKPFHPALQRWGLAARANRILQKWGYTQVRVHSSWRGVLPNLNTRLKAGTRFDGVYSDVANRIVFLEH